MAASAAALALAAAVLDAPSATTASCSVVCARKAALAASPAATAAIKDGVDAHATCEDTNGKEDDGKKWCCAAADG